MVSVRGTRERTQWLERVAGNTTPHTYAPARGPCGVHDRATRPRAPFRERCEAHLDTCYTAETRVYCVKAAAGGRCELLVGMWAVSS